MEDSIQQASSAIDTILDKGASKLYDHYVRAKIVPFAAKKSMISSSLPPSVSTSHYARQWAWSTIFKQHEHKSTLSQVRLHWILTHLKSKCRKRHWSSMRERSTNRSPSMTRLRQGWKQRQLGCQENHQLLSIFKELGLAVPSKHKSCLKTQRLKSEWLNELHSRCKTMKLTMYCACWKSQKNA